MLVNEATQNGTAINQSEPQPEGADAQRESSAHAEMEALRKALATAEEAVRTQRDQYLRAMAELDNVRKRAVRDIENAHRYALEGFVSELLPVRDGLELGLRQGSQADAKTLLEGQQATLKLLDRALEKASVKILDPLGDKFNPAEHEAVLMQPSDTSEPDRVLQVVQTGYQLNGRLLRPARVIVAKANEG
jgi:molecular chaperone GrpE